MAVEFRGPDGPILATTGNISRGGMYIHTPVPLPSGAKAFFTLQLPQENPMKFHLEGEVVWSNRRRRGRTTAPHGMGVRFLSTRGQTPKTLDSIFSVLNTIRS